MKKLTLALLLFALSASAGVVRFATKNTYKGAAAATVATGKAGKFAADFSVNKAAKGTAKAAKVLLKVLY